MTVATDKAALRRKLAEALYSVQDELSPGGLRIIRLYNGIYLLATVDWPQGDRFGAVYQAAVNVGAIPDWPNDADAALTLCLEVCGDWICVQKRESSYAATALKTTRGKKVERPLIEGVTAVTPALALSGLALAALEAER